MSSADQAVITLATADAEAFYCWDDLSITESFDDPLGSYEFTVTPRDQEWDSLREKLRKGELVAIRINDCPLATPIITTATYKLGRESRSIQIECKSVLCTPYEGSSNPDLAKKWKQDVAVDTVVSDILDQYGFDVLVTDSTAHANACTGKPLDGRAPPVNLKALTLRELQGQDGETAYQICSRVFLRLGCAVHVNWQGVVMICRPDYQQASAYALVQDSTFTHEGDRMLLEPPIVVKDSNEGLFSEVVVRGQQPDDDKIKTVGLPIARVGVSDDNRPASAPYSKVPLAPLRYTRHGYQSTAARYKPKYIMDKDCRDAKACRAAARAAYGLRAKEAFQLSCSVSGFVAATGRIWTPNTIADVYIESLNFEERMWILERTFEQSGTAQRTSLKLIPLGALTISGD